MVDIGAGRSSLVDDLLDAGLSRITLVDLSQAALDAVRERLGARAASVRFLAGDLRTLPLPAAGFDRWHDRAVARFSAELRAAAAPSEDQAFRRAVAALDVNWSRTTREQRAALVRRAMQEAGAALQSGLAPVEAKLSPAARQVLRATRDGARRAGLPSAARVVVADLGHVGQQRRGNGRRRVRVPDVGSTADGGARAAIARPFGFAGLQAFGVFLMRQYCSTIPDELIEASRIDGCSELRTFTTVVIPLVRPMIGTFLMITFLGVWNNFITPQVVLQSPERFPLSVAVAQLRGVYYQEYGLQMAGTVVAVLPVLALFLVMQREFVAGLTSGAVKG